MEDWKETLFIWQGILNFSNSNQILWNGTWIGNADPNILPTNMEFKESINIFTASSYDKFDLNSNDPQYIKFDSSYKLDNGDGLFDNSDTTHDLCITKLNTHCWFVVANGRNEYGPFVSKGYINKGNADTDSNLVLTLARRYVLNSKDFRYKMNLSDLSAYLNCSESIDLWACMSLKAKNDMKAKSTDVGKTSKKRSREE